MQINKYHFYVQKDTYSSIPVELAEYEIPILQDIHGDNHVLNFEGKSIEEYGIGEPTRQAEIGREEYDRLCQKYGVALVEKNIGKVTAFMKMFQPKTVRKTKETATATAE